MKGYNESDRETWLSLYRAALAGPIADLFKDGSWKSDDMHVPAERAAWIADAALGEYQKRFRR